MEGGDGGQAQTGERLRACPVLDTGVRGVKGVHFFLS